MARDKRTRSVSRKVGEPGAAGPDSDDVFRINPEYVVATFDDQVLLHHLNRDHTLSLDRTAGIILEHMDGQCSTAEIRELLQRAYPESSDIECDVDRTLRYLLEHEVLDTTTRGARGARSRRVG